MQIKEDRQLTYQARKSYLSILLFQNSINLKGAKWKKAMIKDLQKQPPRGVPRKRCSENMQQNLQENTHAEM